MELEPENVTTEELSHDSSLNEESINNLRAFNLLVQYPLKRFVSIPGNQYAETNNNAHARQMSGSALGVRV